MGRTGKSREVTLLSPIYDTLHKQLCLQEVLHGDETTLQVLKEPWKAAVSKSYTR